MTHARPTWGDLVVLFWINLAGRCLQRAVRAATRVDDQARYPQLLAAAIALRDVMAGPPAEAPRRFTVGGTVPGDATPGPQLQYRPYLPTEASTAGVRLAAPAPQPPEHLMYVGTAVARILAGEPLAYRVQLLPGPTFDGEQVARYHAVADIPQGSGVALDWSGLAWPVDQP